MTAGRRVVVAGLGSEYRRDDGAGAVVAARVGDELGSVAGVDIVGPLGDPLDLLGPWDGADLAVVIDAVATHPAPGSVELVELRPPGGVDGAGPQASVAGTNRTGLAPVTSTHGMDLARVLQLAAAVGRAPARVVVVGIGGADFGRGSGLSPAVEAAVPEAVRRALEVIRGCGPCA